MAELLFELGSEEIPARMQYSASENLLRLFAKNLEEAQIQPKELQSFVTARRLAIVVKGIPLQQPDLNIEQKGPKVGAPNKAVQGFINSVGLTLDQCERRETTKGTFWYAVYTKKGKPTHELLTELIPIILDAIPWGKSMRWAHNRTRWIRPIRSLLCILDGQIVPIKYGNITAGNITYGHTLMSPAALKVTGYENYREQLHNSFVLIDAEERKDIIREGAILLANNKKLILNADENLISENAGLVEWPFPILGKIDPDFMQVPSEVLISAMRKHQKYFYLTDEVGKLSPYFIVISNIHPQDGGKSVLAGNERVLRARLADAKFFWDQDCKIPLATHAAQLKNIVYHARLGTLADKIQSLQSLALYLRHYVPRAKDQHLRQAAQLCKADLSSETVGEFPDLQGVIGYYLALKDGEASEVALAIQEHYSPLGPRDVCPNKPTSIALALADKIDTLLGFFSINEKPTGSKDPYAIRRTALGVVRIILENNLRIPLLKIFKNHEAGQFNDQATELLAFIADRLKVHLRQEGVRHDLIGAVFEIGNEDDIVRLIMRVKALSAFLQTSDGEHLLISYRRTANILRIEEKKDSNNFRSTPKLELFLDDEEHKLFDAIETVNIDTVEAFDKEDYEKVMIIMATLRQPIDSFFEKVKVNTSDLKTRHNRLCLLYKIKSSLDRIADFSIIEG